LKRINVNSSSDKSGYFSSIRVPSLDIFSLKLEPAFPGATQTALSIYPFFSASSDVFEFCSSGPSPFSP